MSGRSPVPSPEAGPRFDRAGLPGARWHLFLCGGPDCCLPAEGEASWNHLKAAIKAGSLPCMRTRAACLRVCTGGPWLVVYPDGIWYGRATPERIDRILREHVGAGQPVREWIEAINPLAAENTSFPSPPPHGGDATPRG